MSRVLFLVAACFTLVACGAAQQPSAFSTTADKNDALDRIVRTLATNGQAVEQVDDVAGVVHTQWQDTGFMYGSDPVTGRTRTLVRRFATILTPTTDGQLVTVRADVKACAGGGFEINGTIVSGACSPVNRIPGRIQNEITQLGNSLVAAFGATAAPVVTAPAQ